MDPAHRKSQDDEYFLQGMIRENVDIDVTRTFLNDSGEGDESLNQGDDSGEVEAWDGGEADEREADKGEGDEGEADEGEGNEGEDDGSGRTLNLGNSGEVYIWFFVMPDCLYIYMHILTLFLILALWIEHFFCQNETRPNKKVG
jgi:hypothetical protein